MIKKWVSLIAAGGLLIAIAMQYPLTNSVPMGDDAKIHLMMMQQVLDNLTHPQHLFKILRPSFYPLAYLAFTPAALLPISWSTRFIWWMVLGHVLTGLALGWFLCRFAGWQSAAVGIAIWALTPIAINHHFEDGTLAQLWSLPWLLIFLERFVARSRMGMAIAVLGTLFTHALSGVILCVTIGIAAPALFATRHNRYLLALTGLGGILFIFFIVNRSVSFLNLFPVEYLDYYFGDLFTSSFSIWLALAGVGLISLLTDRFRFAWPITIMILSFCFVSLMTSINHLLGAGFLIARFHSYFILSVTILASLGLPLLLSNIFRYSWMRIAFVSILFLSLSMATWHKNHRVYAHYVSLEKYQ